MPEVGLLVMLFGAGVLCLVAEIFIPSQGILSVVGLGFLVAGIVKTYELVGETAGIVSICGSLVFVPSLAFVAVKVWHRTPLGRLISPPNPVLTVEDSGVPVKELSELVGKTGRSVSPLRPVGICEFGGKRVSCVVRFGMLDSGTQVEGVGISGSNLTVIEKKV